MAVALPMESNPETMSKYLHYLGVSDKWRMVDVIGLEGEALSWVPRPVLAVILLFPMSEAYEKHRTTQEIELQKKKEQTPVDIFHLKQVMSDICGTVALVHSIANNTHKIDLKEDGLLQKYLNNAKGLDSAAKGALLENTTALFNVYKEIVASETTGGGHEEEPVSNHFVTFVHKDGMLYELDGRKAMPISHGPSSPETLLEDAAKVCHEFIERESGNICFNVVALVPAE